MVGAGGTRGRGKEKEEEGEDGCGTHLQKTRVAGPCCPSERALLHAPPPLCSNSSLHTSSNYERRFKCALHAYLEMGNYCCSCKSQKPAKGEWVQYMHKGSYKPEWARVYSLVPNTFGELTVEFDKHPQLKNRTGFHQLQRHYRQDCQSTPPGGFGRRYRGGCASQGARFRPCQPCDVWRDVLLQAALRQVSRPVMF